MHVLPGGATILCHFWKRQVFRQSLGLKLYVLCLDISSCMGSKITHSFGEDKETKCVKRMLHVHFRLGLGLNKKFYNNSHFAYTEVVECGVGQPTSGDVFGQLIQHLGILYDLIKMMSVLVFVYINLNENGDLHLERTCIAKMLLGRISLCCLMLKCHVLILIMSSNINSRYRRPSTHTWSGEKTH